MATLKVFYGQSYTASQEYWVSSLNVEKQRSEMSEDEFKNFLILKSEELFRQTLRTQTNVYYFDNGLEILICCNLFTLEKDEINLENSLVVSD
jgi:hypothetical protein